MYSVTDRYSENIAKNVTFTAISGTITTTDGAALDISDRNIREGSLSINSKINSSGEFRAGGVCADELSMSLLNYGDGAQSLGGAEIVLEFRLYTDSGFTEYDSVPLGIFVIDSSTIKRQSDTVSFKAYDRLVLFDRSAWEMTNTLYSLISAACGSCGVPLGMSQAEFEALPNGGLTVPVDTSRVQTQRDLLMYAGVLMNSFAKINRAGELVFVQLTCTQDDKNMVVPVRELQGNIRFSTEFSDSTARVTALFMNRDGKTLTNRGTIVSDGSEERLTLEWTENPLLSGMTDGEVRDVLTTAVATLYSCINRAYKAEFNGDPALDIGDYVRLRGGQIDTKRGYGTGMITSQTWRYRGKHTIQCSMPTTVAASATAAAALSADDEGDEVSTNRIPPKSQTEKRLDSMEKQLTEGLNSGAVKLISPDKASHAAVTNDSGLWLYKDGAPWAFLIPLNGGFKLGNTGPAQIEMPCDRNTVAIYNTNNGLWLANPSGQGDILLRGNNSQLSVDGGAKVDIDLDGIQVDGSGSGSSLDLLKTSEGWRIYANNCLLEAKADGLYFNKTKIGG